MVAEGLGGLEGFLSASSGGDENEVRGWRPRSQEPVDEALGDSQTDATRMRVCGKPRRQQTYANAQMRWRPAAGGPDDAGR